MRLLQNLIWVIVILIILYSSWFIQYSFKLSFDLIVIITSLYSMIIILLFITFTVNNNKYLEKTKSLDLVIKNHTIRVNKVIHGDRYFIYYNFFGDLISTAPSKYAEDHAKELVDKLYLSAQIFIRNPKSPRFIKEKFDKDSINDYILTLLLVVGSKENAAKNITIIKN